MTDIGTENAVLMKLSAGLLAGRAFRIKTPQCVRLFANMQRWLSTGMLGAMVFGRPRLGKSSAARWVLDALRNTFGGIPCIEIPIRKQNILSERAFFQHLLLSIRHKFYNVGTTADRRDRFAEALLIRARRSPFGTVILFFDEAQMLEEMHYYWLMNISNELETKGYRLFCLFVGQHQLLEKREKFISGGLEEIVGRFMTEDYAFQGIETASECVKCFEEFDHAVYPEGSNKAFVANYVPLAHQAGWRLKSVSEMFWDEFSRQWVAVGQTGSPIIPMHYFCGALASLLYAMSWQDSETLVVDQKMVTAAVRQCGFRKFLSARRPPDKKTNGENPGAVAAAT